MSTPICAFIVSAHSRPVELNLCLLSLVCQSFPDWVAIVTDNSDSSTYRDLNFEVVTRLNDRRISYAHTGSSCPSCYHSAEVGAALVPVNAPWLAFPSDDSYLCPDFLERMAQNSEDIDLLYCDVLYDRRLTGKRDVLRVRPHVGFVDKTSFMVRREKFIGFPDKRQDGLPCVADGAAIERMVSLGYRHCRVDECLVVHS